MTDKIHTYLRPFRDTDGHTYSVVCWAAQRPEGDWEGWLEFVPAEGAGPALRTEAETHQPNREAMAYWASGLEPVYFDGALDRARRHAGDGHSGNGQQRRPPGDGDGAA